jgi:hypothetical protein
MYANHAWARSLWAVEESLRESSKGGRGQPVVNLGEARGGKIDLSECQSWKGRFERRWRVEMIFTLNLGLLLVGGVAARGQTRLA